MIPDNDRQRNARARIAKVFAISQPYDPEELKNWVIDQLMKEDKPADDKIKVSTAVYVRNSHVITHWFGTTQIPPARSMYVDVSMFKRATLGTFVLN
jgi:hypothetical protein